MTTGKEIVPFSFSEIQSMADAFFKSGIFENVKSVAQAIVKIQAGQEVGLPPIFSMNQLYIVDGRMGMGVQAMGALLKRYNYSWKTKYDDPDNPTACEITFYQNGIECYVSRFTMEDAKRAKLIRPNSGWEKYPKDVLFARAFTGGARKVGPEALAGMGYTVEELQTIAFEPAQEESSVVGFPSPAVAEIEPEAESSPIGFLGLLDKCPEHNAAWHINKFGKRSHKVEGGWCNFKTQVDKILAELAKKLGLDSAKFSEQIKEQYERTWSKLTEEEMVEVLITLEEQAQPDAIEESALVKAAKELGAVPVKEE